jgi:WD40 repeat protein
MKRNSKYSFFIVWLLLLVGCEDSNKPINTWTHSNQGSFDAALDANGDNALIATTDRGTLFWDLKNKQVLYTLSHAADKKSLHRIVRIAHSAPVAITADDKSIASWNTHTGESMAYWKLPARPLDIDLSTDGRFALIGFSDNKARIIDLQTGITWKTFEHADQVSTVALSKNEEYALIGSDDTAARLWNLNTGEMSHQWFMPYKVTNVAISPNNQYALISSSQNSSEIRNIKTGKKVCDITIRKSWLPSFVKAPLSISTALFSKDSQTLYTGSPPRNIRQWDVQSGKLVKEWVIPNRYFIKPMAAVILALATNQENILISETSNGMGYQFLLK